MNTATPHVAVVGGGLAGLSAAIACADKGARVTLFEARPRLGGATWSFSRGGLSLDNGQHVFLRCCTAYRRLLDRLGTADRAPLQERLAIPVLRPYGNGGLPQVSWIRRSALPAPAHLGGALARYRYLTVAERCRVAQAVVALKRRSLDDPRLDDETFAAFLARHGQSDAAVRDFWDLITLPTVNLHAEEASLALAAKVFRTGLIDDARAADIGWAQVPLNEVHVDPAAELIGRLGGVVHRRAKVSAVRTERERAVGLVVDGEQVEADAVVLAVPHEAAADLLPPSSSVNTEGLRRLGNSPIVDVHIVYDRKVCQYPIAAGVGSPLQFVFDKTQAAGMSPGAGQVLAVSISGADAEIGERPEVLIGRYTEALATLFPLARSARVVDAVVSREHDATFRGVPGTRSLRAGSRTGVDSLFLAGAWTDTGWPATMEGAVRSGEQAAAAALASVGVERIRRSPLSEGALA
jgi:squalene-associated FAD-dependent desaturase